jgi:Domain of unknown function (DUF4159)
MYRRSAFQLMALFAVLTTAFGSDTNLNANAPTVPFSEYRFVRLEYTAVNGSRRQRWLTDAPEAEEHLIEGIHRLSRINVGPEARYMKIMDEQLFDEPWVYAVEVGGWLVSEEEAARLREYLLRGGFLVVDDFHGTREWEVFIASMKRIFPDRPIVDIPVRDSVFHVVFDLDDKLQIPGTAALYRGVTYEYDGYTPHWRGVYDDSGRLMVIINFNMDLGDSWEHADDPEYPVHYTASGYQYAINYVLYAMTH